MPANLRFATEEDQEVLWLMLYYASQSDKETGTRLGDIRINKDLAKYVDRWGREGDLGVIAEIKDNAVGAAWLRLPLEDEQKSATFVDAETPELAIAVVPHMQNQGLGGEMLTKLLDTSRHRYPGVSLSARADNPAVRLYERFGFSSIRIVTNRVGTTSHVMTLQFDGANASRFD